MIAIAGPFATDEAAAAHNNKIWESLKRGQLEVIHAPTVPPDVRQAIRDDVQRGWRQGDFERVDRSWQGGDDLPISFAPKN